MVNTRPLAERLWAKIERRGPDECWPWRGPERAYGTIWVDGRTWGAHRVVLHLSLGVPLGGAWFARHTCDNPRCCNPAHLLVGTRQQNADDAVERERTSRGSRRYNAILTEAAVREIRSAPRTRNFCGALAERFGVSRSTIHQIRSRTSWKWFDDSEV